MARQSYSRQFKARAALDTLKGQKTVNETASEHRVHPNLTPSRKKHSLENMPRLASQNHAIIAPHLLFTATRCATGSWRKKQWRLH